MRKLLSFFILFQLSVAFCQTQPETYRFSKDILAQIEKDTVVWKYQTGATELSFSGYYKQVLHVWDKNGVRKPQFTEEDRAYFVKSKKVNAKNHLIDKAKKAEILIINEAHHLPQHRVFTRSLLRDLYANGYRYLGLEALADSKINVLKFPVSESGYYTKEPEFGNLISEALAIGFTLFHYEATPGKNGKEREIEQAENIQNFIKNHPKGKLIIHCGYAHAFENEYPAWGKAMAGRLKENLKIDPLTVDQTLFIERSEPENTPLFIQLNPTQEPIVLMDENGNVFNGKNAVNQTDLVVIHPPTNYIHDRPNWIAQGKKSYTLPLSKKQHPLPLLILAYREKEFDSNGIPADLIEITEKSASGVLYLSPGKYTIVIKDQNYRIVDQYPIAID